MKKQFLYILTIFVLIASLSNCCKPTYENGYYICNAAVFDHNAPEYSECTFWNFLYDENQTPFGKSKCKTSCQCDGRRVCINGCCSGWPRFANDIGLSSSFDTCLTPTYQYDEGIRNNQCNDPCQCGGNRFCTRSGWCHGTAKYEDQCTTTKMTEYQYEINNIKVPEDTTPGCSCTSLIYDAFKAQVDTFANGQSEQFFCNKLLDFAKEKSSDTVCFKQKACSFLVQKSQEAIISTTNIDQPIVGLCIKVVNVIQDFMGINLNQLMTLETAKMQQVVKKGADTGCGILLNSNNQISLNGVNFQSAVESVCALISETSFILNFSLIIILFMIILLL